MDFVQRCLAATALVVRTTSSSPPSVLEVPGGYPRAATLANGTTLLATSRGGAPSALCGLYATTDFKTWRDVSGPTFHAPSGSDVSNCFPGEAPDGAFLVGVRHHDPSGAVYRIQLVRSADKGHSWETPVTVYASTDQQHAAWEPVFYQSLDGKTLNIVYSLERPSDWIPPACETGTNYPGADLKPSFPSPSAAICQGHCAGNEQCDAWSWRWTDQQCWLKGSDHGHVGDSLLDSGAKLCGAGFGSAKATGVGSGSSREQDIVVQSSTDSGRTWGPARVISRTEGSRDGMPSVARQNDGCLICVFEGFGGTSWGDFTVNSVRSCDDGATWMKQSVYPQPSAATAHAPTVAVLPDGRAAVSSYDEGGNLQLQISGLTLAGTADAQWGAPEVIVPGPITWPQVFTGASGGLWAAYGAGGKTHVAGPVSTSLPAFFSDSVSV